MDGFSFQAGPGTIPNISVQFQRNVTVYPMVFATHHGESGYRSLNRTTPAVFEGIYTSDSVFDLGEYPIPCCAVYPHNQQQCNGTISISRVSL